MALVIVSTSGSGGTDTVPGCVTNFLADHK